MSRDHLLDRGQVFASPPSLESDVLERLRPLGVATIASALGTAGRRYLCETDALRRVAGHGCVVGPAVTVWSSPASGRMIPLAWEVSRPGDVLVISTDRATAQWGEVASTVASTIGVAGVVLDGCVRDVEQVRSIGLSLWASRIYAGQGFRHEAGLVNVPVTVGGLPVSPGDTIVADEDGILALPPAVVAEAISRAEAKARTEAALLEQVRSGGGLTPEFLALFGSDETIRRRPLAWDE